MPLRSTLLFVLALAGPAAFAADANNGQHLYDAFCRGCHGFPPLGGPETAAGNPDKIRTAINGKVPTMALVLGGLVTNANIDDIAAYLATLTGTPPPPPPAGTPITPALNYTDMWWGGESESGWGFNVIQHASNNIFGVMYTYDATGKRTWFLIPGGAWTSPTTFTGTWYRSSGPPYSAPFRANQVFEVGTATLFFRSSTEATLTFLVDGQVTTKLMQRLQF